MLSYGEALSVTYDEELQKYKVIPASLLAVEYHHCTKGHIHLELIWNDGTVALLRDENGTGVFESNEDDVFYATEKSHMARALVRDAVAHVLDEELNKGVFG